MKHDSYLHVELFNFYCDRQNSIQERPIDRFRKDSPFPPGIFIYSMNAAAFPFKAA